MARAYMLIKTRVGETGTVADALRRNPNISTVDVIIGPYDLICVIEADDLNTIGNVVMRFVHEVGGVDNTITCPVISL